MAKKHEITKKVHKHTKRKGKALVLKFSHDIYFEKLLVQATSSLFHWDIVQKDIHIFLWLTQLKNQVISIFLVILEIFKFFRTWFWSNTTFIIRSFFFSPFITNPLIEPCTLLFDTIFLFNYLEFRVASTPFMIRLSLPNMIIGLVKNPVFINKTS